MSMVLAWHPLWGGLIDYTLALTPRNHHESRKPIIIGAGCALQGLYRRLPEPGSL